MAHPTTSYSRSQRAFAIAIILSGVTMIAVWLLCLLMFGFLFGLALGWAPGLFAGTVVFYASEAIWIGVRRWSK